MRAEFPAPFPDPMSDSALPEHFTKSTCVCKLAYSPACLLVSVCVCVCCGCCYEDTCCSRAFLPLFLASVPDTVQYLSNIYVFTVCSGVFLFVESAAR